jgi:hypothetical protein
MCRYLCWTTARKFQGAREWIMFKFSPQQYTGVLLSLEKSAAAGRSERRQCTRMDVQAPVNVGIIVDGKLSRCVLGLSRDISITGIGISMTYKCAVNDKVLVALECGTQHIGKEILGMVCDITFCRQLAEGIYNVGAEFDRMAEKASVDELHAMAAAKKAAA